jgi:hypothetical protein
MKITMHIKKWFRQIKRMDASKSGGDISQSISYANDSNIYPNNSSSGEVSLLYSTSGIRKRAWSKCNRVNLAKIFFGVD